MITLVREKKWEDKEEEQKACGNV